jgi:hypothetical protein
MNGLCLYISKTMSRAKKHSNRALPGSCIVQGPSHIGHGKELAGVGTISGLDPLLGLSVLNVASPFVLDFSAYWHDPASVF